MQRFGETLFLVGISYLVFAATGSPWFPWDVSAAVVCIVTGFHLGKFRHRWWPHGPMRESEHESVADSGDRGGGKP